MENREHAASVRRLISSKNLPLNFDRRTVKVEAEATRCIHLVDTWNAADSRISRNSWDPLIVASLALFFDIPRCRM
jgi:hypothetical protein